MPIVLFMGSGWDPGGPGSHPLIVVATGVACSPEVSGETAAGIPNPRWLNASANGQFLFPLPRGTAFYVSGGPGIYWAKGGGSDPGFNVGFGFQLPIRASYRIELGADFHRIPDAHARFLTLQLGVLFR